MWTIFKVSVEFVTVVLLFWLFDIAACGIFASPAGIELPLPALQEVLTTGPPGTSLFITYWSATMFKALYLPLLCLVAQSCLILGNPMDYTGSSVHGDSPGKNTGVGCHSLLQGNLPNPENELRSPALQVNSLLSEPRGKPRNTGVGSLSLLQGIFLAQESNRDLLHCWQTLYQWSYREAWIYLYIAIKKENRQHTRPSPCPRRPHPFSGRPSLGCSRLSRSYIGHPPGILSWSLPFLSCSPFLINGTTHLSTSLYFFLFFS